MNLILIGLLLFSTALFTVAAQSPSSGIPARASGSFDVKMVPREEGAKPAGQAGEIDGFTLDKQYHGDLEGAAHGEMIAVGTAVKGSAGYVAIEKVSATLGGRSGTFLLQHNGLLTRGEGKLSVVVIPDSGTGDLTGLTGSMTIRVTKDGHFYDFEYTLPDKD